MPGHKVQLLPHPADPGDGVEGLNLAVEPDGDDLVLRYELAGDLSQIALPDTPGGARRDELWQHTCFELFLRAKNDPAYTEFNFAPNGDWAAYEFDDYRQGGRDFACPPPLIETELRATGLAVSVRLLQIRHHFPAGQTLLGPSAIIETQSGSKSYWALNHPPGKPDFHRPENFKISLD